VKLAVRSARIAGLWSLLENREIELSLMWDYDWCRIDRDDAVVTPLLDDPPALLVSDQHRLARHPSAALTELVDDPSPGPRTTQSPKPWIAAAEASASNRRSPSKPTTTRKPRPWSPPESVWPSLPGLRWRASGPG